MVPAAPRASRRIAFGSVSGAHFDPAVTITDRWFHGIDTPTAVWNVVAQTGGGILGVVVANIMFDLDAVEWSTKDRSSPNLVFAEGIATLGLLPEIFGVVRAGRTSVVAFAGGAYITGAHYFNSSTRFANPAVTVSRMFADRFAGIRPVDAPRSSARNRWP